MVRIAACAGLLGLAACVASNPVAVSTGPQPDTQLAAAATPAPLASPTPEPAAPIPGLSYEASVLPILERHCQPCHFPGGKIYNEVPFTDSSTVVTNREGVLRRIKDPDERAAITQWLATQP